MTAPERPRVVAVAYDGLCTFEFGIVAEVFGLPRPELSLPWYSFEVAAAEPGPLRGLGGLVLDGARGLDALAGAHTVVVPGWRDPDETPPAALLEALRAAHRDGSRVVSVCSGAFVLAAAGLLDGRRATTHWRYVERLARARPAVTVTPDVLYVDEGDVVTSAGSAAGIDMCLHLVRTDHGADVAASVARRLVVPPHRSGGQAQYVPRPMGPARPDRVGASAVMDWALSRLEQPLGVDDLARHAGMARRTFLRRFRDETGETPHRWLVRQRVHAAQHLLETTTLPVEAVGPRVGFGSVETFRHHFRGVAGTTPSAYRAQFRTAPSDR
ncbi:transcriptional regulator FtrA [Phycicoccus sp. BSK3Z-2]|uniref:Transcriptional regulator FtrA n=1 Tax=Phycicoccus avicenniae TaxID=2828860 RepID=A0A941D9A9_9MICO|nr:transcriptional regulator FtrA [Phycicoccus avicenniae]MBR7743463.1 transcriptional regulator FtrA [Phycicoccus avicenniae]MBR7743947.1 transcriptional regulator FtrA [Phycicoccus avicenniae]